MRVQEVPRRASPLPVPGTFTSVSGNTTLGISMNRGNSSAKKGAGSSATSISPLTALCIAANIE